MATQLINLLVYLLLIFGALLMLIASVCPICSCARRRLPKRPP
jgi:hypothetical protein